MRSGGGAGKKVGLLLGRSKVSTSSRFVDDVSYQVVARSSITSFRTSYGVIAIRAIRAFFVSKKCSKVRSYFSVKKGVFVKIK